MHRAFQVCTLSLGILSSFFYYLERCEKMCKTKCANLNLKKKAWQFNKSLQCFAKGKKVANDNMLSWVIKAWSCNKTNESWSVAGKGDVVNWGLLVCNTMSISGK